MLGYQQIQALAYSRVMRNKNISRRGFLRGLFAAGAMAVVTPQVLIDPDHARWLQGEGRIWQVPAPKFLFTYEKVGLYAYNPRALERLQSARQEIETAEDKRVFLELENTVVGQDKRVSMGCHVRSPNAPGTKELWPGFKLEPSFKIVDGKVVMQEASWVRNDQQVNQLMTVG